MKQNLLSAISLMLLLVSCGPQENPEQLKEVNESLERANNVIIEANKLIDLQWEMHIKDPQVASIAHGVLHRITRVNRYADSVRQVITELKSDLIKQSKDLKMDYVPVARQLYDINGAGYQLFSRMAMFKDSIPAILGTNEYVNRLLDTIPLLKGFRDTLSADQRTKYAKTWLDKCFGRNSSVMAMIMLNKIENDVLTTQKMLFEYCESQICIIPIRYSQYKALAVLSSSYVKKGQPIEITAGVGAFADTVKPRITIDDKLIKLNENDGTGVHRFIADGKPGKHSVIVKIEFANTDGTKERCTKTLNYIIADEK